MKTWEKAKNMLEESLKSRPLNGRRIVKLIIDSSNPGFETTEFFRTLEEAKNRVAMYAAKGKKVRLEYETLF